MPWTMSRPHHPDLCLSAVHLLCDVAWFRYAPSARSLSEVAGSLASLVVASFDESDGQTVSESGRRMWLSSAASLSAWPREAGTCHLDLLPRRAARRAAVNRHCGPPVSGCRYGTPGRHSSAGTRHDDLEPGRPASPPVHPPHLEPGRARRRVRRNGGRLPTRRHSRRGDRRSEVPHIRSPVIQHRKVVCGNNLPSIRLVAELLPTGVSERDSSCRTSRLFEACGWPLSQLSPRTGQKQSSCFT
jgi:hypothetical protein